MIKTAHECSTSLASKEEFGGARKKIEQFWRTLREIVGDDAYERYCEHHRAHHGTEAPLDRRAFYVKSQREKWSGIKRCC